MTNESKIVLYSLASCEIILTLVAIASLVKFYDRQFGKIAFLFSSLFLVNIIFGICTIAQEFQENGFSTHATIQHVMVFLLILKIFHMFSLVIFTSINLNEFVKTILQNKTTAFVLLLVSWVISSILFLPFIALQYDFTNTSYFDDVIAYYRILMVVAIITIFFTICAGGYTIYKTWFGKDNVLINKGLPVVLVVMVILTITSFVPYGLIVANFLPVVKVIEGTYILLIENTTSALLFVFFVLMSQMPSLSTCLQQDQTNQDTEPEESESRGNHMEYNDVIMISDERFIQQINSFTHARLDSNSIDDQYAEVEETSFFV